MSNDSASKNAIELHTEYIFEYVWVKAFNMDRVLDNSGSAVIRYIAPNPPRKNVSAMLYFEAAGKNPLGDISGLSTSAGEEVLIIGKTLILPPQQRIK